MPDVEVADHSFLGGRLLLREPKRGHRSGTDAVLLAAAAPLQPGQHLVDVGAGAGAAGLAVLCRVPGATATLIERDPEMAALARHNIAANGFTDRAEVVEADLRVLNASRCSRLGDVVISNPPFFLAGTTRLSENSQKARSHVLDGMDHGDWAAKVLGFAHPRGLAIIIHRPDALPALLAAASGRAAVRLRTIHPRKSELAVRILLSLAPGRRSPFVIESSLALHDDYGRFTSGVEYIHRGDDTL